MTSIIDDLKDRYNQLELDNELIDIRNSNLDLYYKLDISFLNNVDPKYKSKSLSILNKYNTIDVNNILKLNKDESDSLNILLNDIVTRINKLKETIRDDLNTVIDYVDRLYDKLDVGLITKDTALGILILNKYDSFKIYSAKLDMSDLNGTMKRQAKRLMYLKELDYLISIYKNNICKYNIDNTKVFINNLYEIIGRYLFLLTNNEFEYTKEAIKKVLAYKFDFIDKYIPTYKIILTKIWNSSFTDNYYFICDLNLENDNVYLMNKNNVDKYNSKGYICDIPKDFISYFNIGNMDVLKYPLPCNLLDKYEVGRNSNINLKALYVTKDDTNFKSLLPIIYINKS